MNFCRHRDFEKSYQKLNPQEKELIKKAILQAMVHYEMPQTVLPYGTRMTQLGVSKEGIVYEIRVGIHWRILFIEVKTKSLVIFRLIADHDEVRRFIREFRK